MIRNSLLSLLGALAFSCISVAPSAAESIDVTFINPGGKTSFWGMVSSTMKAAADDLDISLEIIDTERDRIQMLQTSRDIADRQEKPDYVIIVNELNQGVTMLKDMASAGIPVFFLLNTLNQEQIDSFTASGGTQDAILGSVTPDNEIAGYEMARSLIDAVRSTKGEDAQVSLLAILGDSATPAALDREAGLRRAIAETDGAEIVRAFPVLWSREEAEKRSRLALRSLEVDAVWAANDDIAFGAIDAARANGKMPGDDLFFAGLNWSPAGLEGVRDGHMTMTHGGHFFGGAWAMVLLRDIHDGTFEGGAVEFPMSAVDRQNVDLFLERLGGQDWEKIDFKRFLRSEQDGAYNFSADAILRAAGPVLSE